MDRPANPPRDYVLAGLIDFGAGCAQAGYPGVYVRLATPEITSFIAQQARAYGQQLLRAPTPTATRSPAVASGTASLAVSRGRVRHRVAQVAVGCATATCTGTLTLRTTVTVGIAHFAIGASSTALVPVRITTRGALQLAGHRRHLRTRATLRIIGSAVVTQQAFTITA